MTTYTIPVDVDVSPEIIKHLESVCATPEEVQQQLDMVVEWASDMAYGAYGRSEGAPDVE
jgi:hypothetical protein